MGNDLVPSTCTHASSGTACYVLSLSDRTRNPAVLNELSSVGYEPVLVQAIDTRAASMRELSQLSRQRLSRILYPRALSSGEVGCSLSHQNVISDARTDARWILVLEDDALVLPEMSQLSSILNSLDPTRPTALSLFCDDTVSLAKLKRETDADSVNLIQLAQPPNRTVAYVLSARAAHIAREGAVGRVMHRADWPPWASRLTWFTFSTPMVSHPLSAQTSTIGPTRQGGSVGWHRLVWRGLRLLGVPLILAPEAYGYSPRLYVRHELLPSWRAYRTRRGSRMELGTTL